MCKVIWPREVIPVMMLQSLALRQREEFTLMKGVLGVVT